MGLAEKMSQYVYRRGYANCVDCELFTSPVPCVRNYLTGC